MTSQETQDLLDTEHLRLLRLGYLISGIVSGVWACFPLIHVTLGMMFLMGAVPGINGDGDTRQAGLAFVIIGLSISFIFATIAVLKLLTARYLRERRRKTFCMIVAALTCFGIPYGTMLGAFTFVVLARPSVDAMFRKR